MKIASALLPSERLERPLFLTLLLIVFTVVLLRTAWLCDDAYITFRTVENFVAGHGLRYNVAERVQTYTHPLWMFLVLIVHAMTREFFYSISILSVTVSIVTVALLLFRCASLPLGALLATVLLLASRGFMDYSTSGLENPLTHLLLAVFFIVYCGKGEGMRRVFAVSLIAGLGILNRMDTILLYAPALIYELFRYRSARACCIALAGFAPFIVWEGFSLFYYGFLFPNPAYAKLMNAGLAMTDLFRNGGFYFLNSLKTDPVTLPAIAAAMVYPFVFRDRRLMALAAGVLLYLLYILRIGGDFMSGRFFSAPFFLATLILASDPWVSRRRVLWVILAGAMVLGALSPAAPLLSGRNYTMISDMEPYYWDDHGIADERAFYFRWFGLIRDQPSLLSPETSLWTQFGRASRTEGSPVKFFESVGILGQEAGPGVHIVDVYGLCDPLLARLPPAKGISHRAGHYTRVIPAGYLDTLLHGDNRIVDERLARYYDKLSLITRGDLWDMKRLSAIWNMTWGRYGDPKDYGDYAEPLSPIPSSGTESFPDG